LGPIGSAVLTFIGYKQTDKHPNRQAKFIYRYDAGSTVQFLLYLISLYFRAKSRIADRKRKKERRKEERESRENGGKGEKKKKMVKLD